MAMCFYNYQEARMLPHNHIARSPCNRAIFAFQYKPQNNTKHL